jgi:predicted RNA-binding Zn-ribbon protein involved in translation (DUF1610 family)
MDCYASDSRPGALTLTIHAAKRYNPIMRRSGRWLSKTTVVGLTLLISATVALWARSHWREYRYQTADRYWNISAGSGRMWFTRSSVPYWAGDGFKSLSANPRFDAQFDGILVIKPAPSGHLIGVCGFGFLRYLNGRPPNANWDTRIGVPFWFIFLLELMLAIIWLRWRRSQPRPGTCTACGYDLTGNVSGVCPECGKPLSLTHRIMRNLSAPSAHFVSGLPAMAHSRA